MQNFGKTVVPLPYLFNPQKDRKLSVGTVNITWKAIPLAFLAGILFFLLFRHGIHLNGLNLGLLSSSSSKGASSGQDNIGTSPGYLKAALHLMNSINHSADPCVDFYEYACGKYVSELSIPPNLFFYGETMRLFEDVNKNMKRLLESSKTSSSKAIETMKKIYKSCLKEEEYVERAPLRALEAIKDVGMWPLMDGHWDPAAFDMQKLLTKLITNYSVGVGIFSIDVDKDMKDHSIQILFFDQGALFMDMNYHREPEKFRKEVEAHKKNHIDLLELFVKDVGIQRSERLEKDIEEIFAFEGEIARIMKLKEERRNYTKMDNKIPFKVFNEKFKREGGIDVKQYALDGYPSIAHPLINSDDVLVMLPDPKFSEKLAVILKNVDRRIFTNYVMLRLFTKYSSFFGKKYKEIDFELVKKLTGKKEQSPQWEECNGVAASMKMAYGALYARNYFDKESKELINDMVEKLKESFIEMLEENNWMDKGTKEKAKEKALKMIALIGYGEMAFDDVKLDEYYKEVKFVDKDYISTMFGLKRVLRVKSVAKSLKPMDRREFSATAATMNAFYAPARNSLLFPAAFLQFPHFLKDQPQAMNFGAIGTVIGHEITHGFDDRGKQFSGEGKLENWWNAETQRHFDGKKECMEKQYGDVEVPGTGMNINGKMTIGENIADNGGIRESFKAYKKFIAERGREPVLPGLKLTSEQLFFHGYATFWCSAITPEYLKMHLLGDNHSPAKYRTNLVLQNQPEFAEAFKCPAGSPMNPKNRCVVW